MQVDKSTKSSYLDYDKTELELFFNSLGSNAITFTVPVFQSSYFSYLDLSKTQLQDSALNFISLLPGIKHLKMSQCSLITNSGISFLAKMTSLITLDISKCRNLGDIALQYIVSLDQLKVLNLSSLKISDASGPLLPSNIVNLDLSGTLVTHAIVSSFSSSLKVNLEYLSLAHSKVSNISYEQFQIEEFTSLRRLNLDGNSVSFDGSIVKLRDRINDFKGAKLADIRNGMLEIKNQTEPIAYGVTASERIMWQNIVFPFFVPYLNQTTPWPLSNGISGKKREFAQTNKLPTPKKKRPEIDMSQKENFINSFDLVFPKNKEVYQSIHMNREDKSDNSPESRKRSIQKTLEISPIKPKTLGTDRTLPLELTNLLDLKNMSPVQKKSRK